MHIDKHVNNAHIYPKDHIYGLILHIDINMIIYSKDSIYNLINNVNIHTPITHPKPSLIIRLRWGLDAILRARLMRCKEG